MFFSPRLRVALAALAGCCVLLLSGLPGTAHAQSRLLILPDRPGSSIGASTVRTETMQAEFGYAYNNADGFTSHEVGQLLLRYGVNSHLELRANINSYVITEDDAGYGGPGFGAKVQAPVTSGIRLGAATMTHLPTGNDPQGGVAERPRQDFRLIFEGTLARRLALLINSGTRFYFDADARQQWIFIPALRARLTPGTRLHVGYAAFYRAGVERRWAEAGLMFRMASRTQLDVNAGRRLGSDDRFFLGTGLTHRF